MKDYSQYGVEDFITNESYLRYYFRENEADIAFWTEWIKLHPEKLDVVISANNYIDAFSVRISETEFQKEQQRFNQALDDLSEQPDIPYDYTRRNRNKRVATILLMLIAVSALVYVTSRNNNFFSDSRESENVAQVEKYVPKGERAKITLPDGSEVELNADSKLIYPAKFTGATREVQLTGEAFFRVQHDAQHPFHITANKLAVTVLGTTFNMQCYPNQNQAAVALVTGKVKLNKMSDSAHTQTPEETIILTPSEMGVLNKQNASLGKTTFDINEETGWRRGIVVFKNADFTEIADRFDKVYNIRLVNLSHKKEFRFNGSFDNTSPAEIVKSICLSKQLSWTTNGNVITIH